VFKLKDDTGGRNRLVRAVAIVTVVIVAGCTHTAPLPTTMKELTFLRREGCSNTATMRARLDAALAAMKLPTDYVVLDLATVPADDPRGGYPTPTLLYRSRDLFGMPPPPLPHPEPT
jgi:hypothetical protein